MLSFLLLMLAGLVVQLNEDAASKIPELKTLDHYAGVWDVEMTIDPLDPNRQSKTFHGQAEAKWTVGGRFLEQTGSYRLSEQGQPLTIKTLMTYDTDQQRYHYWLFLSDGNVRESVGQWNEQSKTMISTITTHTGDVTTTTADFSQQGIETWKIETRRADDSLVLRIRGKNVRRKSQEVDK